MKAGQGRARTERGGRSRKETGVIKQGIKAGQMGWVIYHWQEASKCLEAGARRAAGSGMVGKAAQELLLR